MASIMEVHQIISNASNWFHNLDSSLEIINCFPTIIAISSAIIITVKILSPSPHSTKSSVLGTKEKNKSIVLKNIQSRRTIYPKDCKEHQTIEKIELDTILEAANWAPTHFKTE